MSDPFKHLLARVAAGHRLTTAEARKAFELMMTGEATLAQMGAFLMGLHMRGETVAEITGGAETLRAFAKTLTAPPGAIDTCGTGGDGGGTYNISTAAGIVAAACGVPVAKHGNRAQSSKTGTADVLAELGVNIDADFAIVQKAIWEAGFGFMLAPSHHNAMRYVVPVRKELGVRTIFNLLGPLANPAGTKRQLLGVFSRDWIEPLAHVLHNLGAEKVWVVHGSDGLDELTTTGPSYVAALENGVVRTFEVTPEDAGLKPGAAADLKGGDSSENAAAISRLLEGEKGAYRDIVLLNAAAALVVADKARDLKTGAEMAAEAIDSGKAAAVLGQVITLTAAATEAPS